MTRLDKRFALLRDGKPWYAALIEERGTGDATYRVSEVGRTRDAHGQAEKLADVETVARRVLKEGRRMRCAPEGGTASSLHAESRGIDGYRLDAVIASTLGVPPEGNFR